jgi:hypothetical protein
VINLLMKCFNVCFVPWLFSVLISADDVSYHMVGRGVHGCRVTPVKYE